MSTVHICLNDIFGVAVACEVIFYPGDTPFINGAALAVSGARSIRLDAGGNGEVALLPGRYTVRFLGITGNTDALQILVPREEGVYQLAELVGGELPRDFLQKSKNLSDVADPATAFEAIKQAATAESAGVICLATQEEVDAGTDTTKAISPETFANAAKWATAGEGVRLVSVADAAERLALAATQVAVGNLVEQTDTRTVYQVLDVAMLNQETGYVEIGVRPAPTSLNTALLAFWNLDEESGVRVDATGNGHDLSDINGATSVPGVIGNAAYSDGNQSLGSGYDFALRDFSSFSVLTWFKCAPGEGNALINDYADGWGIYATGGPSSPPALIYFWNGSTSNGTCYMQAPTDLRDNAWHQIGLVRNGDQCTLYVDGLAVETVTATLDTPFPVDVLNLLGNYDGNDRGAGAIDLTGVWERALSDAEVAALYNNGNGLAYPFA